MSAAAESVMSRLDARTDFRWCRTAVVGRFLHLLLLLETLGVAQNVQMKENVPAQAQKQQIEAEYLECSRKGCVHLRDN